MVKLNDVKWTLGRMGLTAVVGIAACSVDSRDGSEFGSVGSQGIDSDGISGSGVDTDVPADGPGGGDDPDSGGSGVKLDVGAPSSGTSDGCGPEGCAMGCSSVDLVFIIDNSGSMSRHQESLALAFPSFAAVLSAALPPGTSLHVGVTSTEMGYSNTGTSSNFNGQCTFTGAGGQDETAFYVTPDATDTGRNGAQGRLYDPGDGRTYVEFQTPGTPAEIDALAEWFADAARVGESGSNIEMATAPVGWLADPANAATNAGFVRDAGSVLVLFFVQDEPDQTPLQIDGMPGHEAMLERIVAAKSQCGGVDCIVAGGFLEEHACDRPLGAFIHSLGTPPVVRSLPPAAIFGDDPEGAAEDMRQLLGETLAGVIAQTCDSIPPAG